MTEKQARLEVTDEMVERAIVAFMADDRNRSNWMEHAMRAALSAALGRDEA